MTPILESFPSDWETLVWDNGRERCEIDGSVSVPVHDMGPYGRFAAIKYSSNDLILVQDDDVIISDPQQIVDAWVHWRDNVGANIPYLDENPDEDPLTSEEREFLAANVQISHVVCNLPSEFRPHYPDSAMVGFGAVFHRDAPEKAFTRFFAYHHNMSRTDPLFLRESCRIFTVLTPRVIVDIPKTDMPYASDPDRLWKQPGHVQSRDRALALARRVRDA
jgi:hypothetical protein